MKITLEYDPASGTLTDKNGIVPANYIGLVGFEPELTEKQKDETVLELIKAKVSPDDIIKMKNYNVI